MGYVFLILQAAAVTLVFTRGSIFEALRGEPYRAREAEPRLLRLFRDWASCPLCSGVWIGAAFYAVQTWGSARLAHGLQVLGIACIVGVLASLLYMLLEFLDSFQCPEEPPPPPENDG